MDTNASGKDGTNCNQASSNLNSLMLPINRIPAKPDHITNPQNSIRRNKGQYCPRKLMGCGKFV
jgi:hypothetical protein